MAATGAPTSHVAARHQPNTRAPKPATDGQPLYRMWQGPDPPPATSPPRCDRKQLQAWSQPPAQRRLFLVSARPRIGEIKQGRDAIHVRHA